MVDTNATFIIIDCLAIWNQLRVHCN